MAKLSIFICSLYFLLLTSYSLAMTEDQKAMIRSHFEKIGLECIKDNPIDEEDIANLRSHKVPSGPMAPCFLACMFRKIGIMDDKGMLQKETFLDLAKQVFNDPEELKSLEAYLHSCFHINEEAVSDGEKGCERAMLSYKCMLDNASQFNFAL